MVSNQRRLSLLVGAERAQTRRCLTCPVVDPLSYRQGDGGAQRTDRGDCTPHPIAFPSRSFRSTFSYISQAASLLQCHSTDFVMGLLRPQLLLNSATSFHSFPHLRARLPSWLGHVTCGTGRAVGGHGHRESGDF